MTIARVLTVPGCRGETLRVAALALFASLTAFAGVFFLPPLDRDESRFAQATAQMLETGDFISIRFQEDERNKKPAGVYWLQAASVSTFSNVEAREIWAYRIPSAIGAIIAVLFTYAAGRRLFGPEAGLLASLLIAAAPALAGEATIAKTDALLLAATAGGMAAFIHIVAAVNENRRARLAWPIAFWVCLGAGVLLKGPIVLMVAGLGCFAFFLRAPQRKAIGAMQPFLGALILGLMIGPWAFAIHDATDGRFFVEALGGDMLSKVGAAQELHAGPPGYYLALLPLLFWPAAALAPLGMAAAVAERRDWRSWLLLSWIVPCWIVFELAATKLPHYTLPLYPAIAILAAQAAVGIKTTRPLLMRIGAVVYLIAGLLIAAVISGAPAVFEEPGIVDAALVTGPLVAIGTIFVARAFWLGKSTKAAAAAVALSAAAACILLAGVLPRLEQLALSPRLDAAVKAQRLHPIDDGAPSAVLAGYYEPSAIFLLGTQTILTDGKGAADRFMEARRAVIVEGRMKESFLARLAERGGAAVAAAVVEGLNYSNGDEVALTLYRPAPQPDDLSKTE